MDETVRYSKKKKAHQSSAMGINFFFFVLFYGKYILILTVYIWYCQINDRLLLSLLFFLLKIYIWF